MALMIITPHFKNPPSPDTPEHRAQIAAEYLRSKGIPFAPENEAGEEENIYFTVEPERPQNDYDGEL